MEELQNGKPSNGVAKSTDEESHSRRAPLKFLGITFAPLDVPAERRLQTLVTFLVITWFMGGWMGSALSIYYLLQSRFWWIPLLYVGWYIWDWDQENRGGRRSNYLRSLGIFKIWSAYFPVTLTKTADLPLDNNYIFAYHPHGIIGMGVLCSFMTEATGFSQQFPGLIVHQLTTRLGYIWPVAREFFMAMGASNASKENIRHITLTKNNAIVVVVGGAMESMDAHPGSTTHVLKHRKGFVRMALKTGSHLVPVYGFGENELFRQVLANPPGSLVRKGQRFLQKTTGMVPVFFYGRGLFNYNFGWMPHRHPINVVVGEPVLVTQNSDPTEEEVAEVHQRYQDALVRLFEAHKDANGYGDKVLEFI
ncbi:2-acylglycerol O-acyltransferase 2-A [Hypsibius exemplaris]|uniref:Acyltransferase n=1 Tax=Hypsibius exemplaris TaxID=2072580 RepID=A0A1W0WGA0_HYPEX|nr:2-acylglycerol O-acyltransferase 2-A [Hypsibius exemplaris]